jgi:hypothetical protein
MENIISGSMTAYTHRAAAWLIGSLAVMALVLGVVGLYGVVAYSVGRRTREIGVRMALGAERGAVYRMVLGEAGTLALWGILIGALGAVAAAHPQANSCSASNPGMRGRSLRSRQSLRSLLWGRRFCPRAVRPASRRWRRCEWSNAIFASVRLDLC